MIKIVCGKVFGLKGKPAFLSVATENDVGGVSTAFFEKHRSESPSFLGADHGFDHRFASEFALDRDEDTTFLTGDKDASPVLRIAITISRFDEDALNDAADQALCPP